MSRLRTGRPDAARAIWHSRAQETHPLRAPAPRNPRLLGSLQALVGASFALAIFLFWSRTVGIVVLCISAVILLSALASPNGLYRGVRGLFSALGNLTGRALTWIMLVPLFYVFFLPFGLVLRRGRRDRLRRYFEPEAESYWETHRPSPADAHERQF